MFRYVFNKWIIFVGIITFSLFGLNNKNVVYAASQNECAIWLCLPGGFPQGCGAAHSAMIKRLKKRKPPMPSFGSCSSDGSGSYTMGIEYFEPCSDGYELKYLRNSEFEHYKIAECINMHPACVAARNEQYYPYGAGVDCNEQAAIRRPKPNFVEIWVNDEHLGKFFYQ